MKQESKILLTCILKDDSEAELAERMFKSFLPHCSGLVVALTGISGQFAKLKKLIKKHGGKYVECSPETHPQIYAQKDGKWFFANFAAARNVSFELADKEDADWWTWADVDDILINGEELQLAAKKASELKQDSVFFPYWYHVKVRPDNTFGHEDVVIEHLRERLLRPGIWKWVSRLHEVAVSKDDNYQLKQTLYDFNPKENRSCAWVHLNTNERVTGAMMRNIQILDLQARDEQHKDPRTLFYLAKTYFDCQMKEYDDLADLLIDEYLEMSGWPEERANAWIYKANIRTRRGDDRGAIECLHNAAYEYPNHHMIHLLLSRAYAATGQREKASFWLDVAMKMDPPAARTTIGNPLEIKFLAASLKYNEAISKQDLKEAIKWLQVRNEMGGIEEDGLLKTLEEAKQMNDAAIWVFNYSKWLKDTGNGALVKHILEAVPHEMRKETFYYHLANEVQEPTTWPEKSIVYFAGSTFAEFDPETAMVKGMGGSETALIRLSEEWVKLGYQVTVYANVTKDCTFNGVTYKYWASINWQDHFDTIIIWRQPQMIDNVVNAKKLFVDLHDVASIIDYPKERLAKITKVFVKSKWHRENLAAIPDNQIVVISNGI